MRAWIAITLHPPERSALATTNVTRTLDLSSKSHSHRERPRARATERSDRVRDGRRDRRHSELTDAARRRLARHDLHHDLGHLVDAQDRMVVEVALYHAAVLELDLAVQRGAEAEGD